jgi:hypothetical protein
MQEGQQSSNDALLEGIPQLNPDAVGLLTLPLAQAEELSALFDRG